MRRKFYVSLAAAVAALITFTTPSFAKKYPDRPIRVITPLPPGGSVDIAARLPQPLLEKSLGQSLVIDNRSGGERDHRRPRGRDRLARRLHAIARAHHVFHHRRAASEAAVRSVARVTAGHGGRPERAACAGQSQGRGHEPSRVRGARQSQSQHAELLPTPGAFKTRRICCSSCGASRPASRCSTKRWGNSRLSTGWRRLRRGGNSRGRLPHGLWRTDSRQLSTSRRLRCKNSARRQSRPSFRSASRPNSTSSSI